MSSVESVERSSVRSVEMSNVESVESPPCNAFCVFSSSLSGSSSPEDRLRCRAIVRAATQWLLKHLEPQDDEDSLGSVGSVEAAPVSLEAGEGEHEEKQEMVPYEEDKKTAEVRECVCS